MAENVERRNVDRRNFLALFGGIGAAVTGSIALGSTSQVFADPTNGPTVDEIASAIDTIARATYIVRKPVFVFIDDDGWQSVYTTLKPIFDARGLKCTLAIPPGQLKDNKDPAAHPADIMTIAQVKQMYGEGYDIQSHTWTHYDFSSDPTGTGMVTLPMQDDETMHFQLSKALEWFAANGIEGVKHLIYPRGELDQRVMDATALYYESGITTKWGVTYPPIPSYQIRRCSISNGTTLDQDYAVVDETFANNGICIFMTHISQLTPASKIIAVLDYITERQGEIITYSQMWNRMKNVLEVGQQLYDTYRIPFAIGYDGSFSGNLTQAINITTGYDSIPFDAPLTDYPAETETVVNYRTDYARNNLSKGMPEPRGGTLRTTRYDTEDVSAGADAFAYQTYRLYDSERMYYRRWTSGNWTTWLPLTTSQPEQGIIGTDTFTLDNSLMDFPINTFTRCFITKDGEICTRPDHANGMLETNRFEDTGAHSYQIYTSTQIANVFYRKWNLLLSGWDEWVQISSTDNCGLLCGTFANRPLSPKTNGLWLATDKPTGDPNRLTAYVGGSWRQI